MSTATLSGHRVTSATVNIPAWGAWHATAVLDEEVTLAGPVVLTIADLTLVGTVVSGGPSRGRALYRIVGGAGGWGRQLARLAYSNDAGVRLATVVGDAAAAVGEILDAATVDTSARLGAAWVRPDGTAGRVLELVAREAWYVGEDGVTRLGRRAMATLNAEVTRTRIDPERSTVELAADAIATILPGIVVDGIEAVDVQHELTDRTLRSTIWGRGMAAGTSRRGSALRRLVEQLLPNLPYLGVHEYRVVSRESERLNLQPVKVSAGMPELRRVRQRPGIAGCRADVALGSRVLVVFVDADPSRPVVISHEDAESPGFAPGRLDLVGDDELVSAASAAGRCVRFGDSIMMPSGAAATLTPTVVVANPAAPSHLSRVFP